MIRLTIYDLVNNRRHLGDNTRPETIWFRACHCLLAARSVVKPLHQLPIAFKTRSKRLPCEDVAGAFFTAL